MTLSSEQINDLPVGASYQDKSGNATGTVKKTEKGIEFTANCDSLNILIDQLTTEVHRYKSENSALKTTLSEQKVIEVNVLTGWQHFQLKGFWLLLIVLTILIFNKSNLWQKIIKAIAKLIK